MNLLSVHDVSDKQLKSIFELADVFRLQCSLNQIAEKQHFLRHMFQQLSGRIVGTLFLEPSTRTRMSFESASHRLGLHVVSSGSSENTSLVKGESLEDTINTVSQYVDLLVVRSNEPLTDVFGNYNFCIPNKGIINAGDGPHEHPTQAMLDVYTILQHHKRTDKLHIGISGDLIKSRSIHSLIGLLGRNSGNTFTVFNPTGEELAKEYEPTASIFHCETEEQFKRFIPKMDVVYLNRVQRERWSEQEKNAKNIRVLSFDKSCLNLLRQDAIVMNPGPRLDEMPTLDDKRIVYFEQARNGLFVRMAILQHVFSQ